jgi:hypothetical protein
MNFAPRRRFSRIVFVASLAIGLTLSFVGSRPNGARASIIMALDLPTLVQEADHIAVVEVASVRTAWDERHERIYSTIDLTVIETWKAPPGSALPPQHLTIVQPGGTVGDITMTVTGLGSFAEGERSLVFLRGPANRAQVVGMTQGKRPVRYESASRKWLVAPPDLRQAKLVRPPAGLPVASPPLPSHSGQNNLSPPAHLAPSRPAPTRLNQPEASAMNNGSRDLPLDDMRAEIQRLVGTAARP